jgi:hypothetical protein
MNTYPEMEHGIEWPEVSGTSKATAKRQLLERTSAAANLRYGTLQLIVEVL